MEEQLKAALIEWSKANNGEQFTWNGENYLDIMKRQEEEERHYKEELRARKVSSLTPYLHIPFCSNVHVIFSKEKQKQERLGLVSSNIIEKENVQANVSVMTHIRSKTPLPSKQLPKLSRTTSTNHLYVHYQ